MVLKVAADTGVRGAPIASVLLVLGLAWFAPGMASVELGETVVSTLDISSSLELERGQFEEYISRHQKQYPVHERERRFQNFRESLAFVQRWNTDPDRKFKVGLNEFADLSQQEFADKFLVRDGLETDMGHLAAGEEEMSLSKRASLLPEVAESAGRVGEGEYMGTEMGSLHQNSGLQLPREVDWSDLSGKVYKQGVCAACYTFTTNSAIKAQWEKKTGQKMPELSDQEILSCSQDFGNHGCVGGNMEKSYHYILGKRHQGQLALAKDYPYEGTATACKANRFDSVQSHLVGYRKVQRGSEADLEDALAQQPVAVGIDAHHPAFKLYESGTFDIDYCTPRMTHAVLLTGYGVDEDGTKYYTLKNSWGTGWGQKGFGRIKRGVNMCAIANLASYPIVDASKQHNHMKKTI